MTVLCVSQSQWLAASVTPERFTDGFVCSRETGYAKVKLLSGEEIPLRLFEAPADVFHFPLGELVAYHSVAGVLATPAIWASAKELIVS